MKIVRRLLFVAVIGLMSGSLVTSCTTTKHGNTTGVLVKRKYNKGFHVNLKGKADKVEQQETKVALRTSEKVETQKTIAASSPSVVSEKMEEIKRGKATSFEAARPAAKPTSYKEALDQALAQVVEANPEMTAKETRKLERAKKVAGFVAKKMDKKVAKNELAGPSSMAGKSQLIALLLCGFLGTLGAHRFYLGYIGIGVIQLLTAGGCGIWALIDFIMIITGKLQPNGERYSETF